MPDEKRQTFYVTFGFDHTFRNCFIQYDNATETEVREELLSSFGKNWGFMYTDTEWYEDGVSQQEKFSLTKIEGAIIT